MDSGNGYDGWTGAVRRRVVDIEIPGTVSSQGLKYVRTYSSSTDGWTGSYSWYIVDRPWTNDKWTETGRAHFPDGRIKQGPKERLFERDTTPPGEDQVGSQAGEYDLYLEDGSRVYFTRVSEEVAAQEYYWVDRITPHYVVDPHGNRTTLVQENYTGAYNGNTRLSRVVDEGSGRWLQFTYVDPNAASNLKRIDGSDGQWVDYSGVDANGNPAPAVQYSDGTSASYTSCEVTTKSKNGTEKRWPALETARDTRAEGPMQSILYKYKPGVHPNYRGQVEGEYHYPNGPLVSQFESNATEPDGMDFEATNREIRGDGPSRSFQIQKTGDAGTDFPVVLRKTDFNGVSESYVYEDVTHWLKEVTDRRGFKTTYTNTTEVGNPLTVTHPGGTHADGTSFPSTQTVYAYTDNDNPYYVASVTDDRGKQTLYTRDTRNRIERIDYPDGAFETFEYQPNAGAIKHGGVIKHRQKNGYYVHATYDDTGLLTGLWNPSQSAARIDAEPHYAFTYYATGPWKDRVETVTDPRGYRTTSEYDRHFGTGAPCPGRGLVSKISYPDDTHGGAYSGGTSQSFTYDIYGNKLTETNELGQTTINTYDDYMRLTSVTLPATAQVPSAITTYDYTATNGLAPRSPYSHTTKSIRATTSPTGIVTGQIFDVNFRLASKTDAEGTSLAATTRYEFDANGNQTRVTDPRGTGLGDVNYTTSTEYDSRNRKTRMTSPPAPAAQITQWGYDDAGNVTSMTRPDGTVESKTYDAMNRLLSETMPKDPGVPITTAFTYWPAGTLRTVKDAKDQVTSFEYNGFDLKSKMIYPNLTEYQLWNYDGNKNLTSRRTAANDYQVFTYDERNRKKSMGWHASADPNSAPLAWANGTGQSTFDYDKAGRLKTAANDVSTVTRGYDEAGRLLSDMAAFAEVSFGSKQVEYTYRADGKATNLYVPPAGEYDFDYAYDAMGRLELIKYAPNPNWDYQYTYDAASNVTRRENHINGTGVVYTRDNLNRIPQREINVPTGQIASGWYSREHYGFDPMNRLTDVTRDEDGKGDAFGYNLAGELTSAAYGSIAPTPTPTATPSQVATPTFSPGAGAYPVSDYPKSITITTTTAGAKIRYTTNGTTPNSSTGMVIEASSGMVSVPAGATLKAIAFKSGMSDSMVQSGLYSGIVATPTFSPAPGAYPASDYPKTITIATATAGSNIRYTTDGTAPTSTTGALIAASSGTASVPVGANLKAIAFKSGYSNSAVASGVYSGIVATPTFSPAPGAYPASDYPKTITIATATAGSNIRYTTNGTAPTSTSGTLIAASSGTASVPVGATLKAIAFKSGYSNSAVQSGVYSGIVATPTFDPAAGPYPLTDYPKTITISTATAGANIRYTTDGTTPTPASGTLIAASSGTASVGANVTLKAIAFKSGLTDSAVASGLYSVAPAVVTPVFNPPPGAYPASDYPKGITVTTATPGANIRYTTDGTTPTSTTGALIAASSGTATVPANATLKAIAFKSGMSDSEVQSGDYSTAQAVATPAFIPAAGSYPATDYPKTITISTTTVGANIRYTINGPPPTSTTGTLIAASSGTASVPGGSTLQAIAFKSGLTDSDVASGLYEIADAVKTPTYSPVAGAYPASDYPKTITITTETAGANIRYTTDEMTPTPTSGTLIAGSSGTASVAANATLKAMAFKPGMTDSAVASGVYSVAPAVATPTYSPVAGAYPASDYPKTITISTTAGASIRYTTNGTTPTPASGTLIAAGGTASVAAGATLKAIAFKSGMTDSMVQSGVYSGIVATPTFSPAPGAYPASDYPKIITIATATAGSNIRYTTDGTAPTSTTGALIAASSGTASVPVGATLKAIAYKSGYSNSALQSGVYSGIVATPTYNPAAGAYPASDYPKTITIATGTAGANIRYTTNGSTPSTTSGTLIAASSGTASVAAGATLKAIAFKSGWSNSAVQSGVYSGIVATPTYSPVAGAYPASDYPKTITISTATAGANIRYTTSGTAPTTTTGTLIAASSGTASVPVGATLKAIAFKSGYSNSAVQSGVYSGIVATPSFSPAAGAYPASDYPKTITIATGTAGANIRYTTNGATPSTTSGTLIAASSGTASVPVGATLKAIAFRSGWSNSGVASGVYSGIVATPTYNPAAGTYPASDYPKTITIATGTAGSNIRYTTNGTTPTTASGTLIAASSGTASVPGGATLKAIAFKSGYANSAVQSGVFAVVPQVAPVIIDDDCGSNGCYPNYAHVTMSTGTANATIFYTASTSGYVTPTHSGATPTGNTAIYSGPIEVVFQRKYFSAVGYKAGLNDSGVTQFEEDNTNPNLRPAPIQPAAASAAMGGGAAPEWSAPARTVGYVLDKAGNRLSVDESGVGTQSYVPNNLNQYESVDGMGVNHGASHETTGHEGVTYSYVGDTYLARAQAGSNTYTLYYDALGRCVKRKLNGVSKYYLFEGEHWIMEYDATGANISNVLYGLGIDEIIARGVSGQPQWPLPDRNGNTSVVTTNGGAILEQYRYDAFGAPTITDANGAVLPASAIKNPFLFTGREWAPANLGFYEYRARAYHPGLGRFMSEDPIGFDAKDFNLFRYVSNDPLDRTDPMGLDAEFTLMRDPYVAGPDANPRLSPATMRITENGRFMGAIRVNENPFYPGRQGIPPGRYLVLPKAKDGINYPAGTPAVTSPSMKDKPGATTAGHPEGSILIHGKGPEGQADSKGCITCSPTGLKLVKDVFNRNKDSTTMRVYNGPEVSRPNEIPIPEKVLGSNIPQVPLHQRQATSQ